MARAGRALSRRMSDHLHHRVEVAGPDAVASLEQLLSHNARRTPDALALLDPPDRPRFTDSGPRRLTYAQLERTVSAAAQRLDELALPPGSVVGLQLPNTGEAIVMLLAVMRARLIAALLPLRWREADIGSALHSVDAAALITCQRIGTVEHAHIALAVALEVTCVRYLCGFGPTLPDGFVPLDDVFETDGHLSTENQSRQTPCPIGVITFDRQSRGPVPFARSHIELFAGGLAVMMEARLQRGATILSTIATGSFAGLASAVIPWLLTGGALALHHPFDPEVFREQLRDEAADAIVIPQAILEPLLADEHVWNGTTAPTVLSLWRPPAQQASAPSLAIPSRLVDVVALAEWAVVPMRRDAGAAPALLRPGAWTPSGAVEGTPALLRLGQTPHQTVAIGGAMTPHEPFSSGAQAFRYTEEGLVETGIAWPRTGDSFHSNRSAASLESPFELDHIEVPRASVA